MAVGIPDELFWGVTPIELRMMLDARAEISAVAGAKVKSVAPRGPKLTGQIVEAFMVKTGRKRKVAP